MPWTPTESRYSKVSITLHWLMLVLLVLVYTTIEFRGVFPKDSDGRALLKALHFMLGLSVFVLVWLRLFARSRGAAPQIVPAAPRWQALLATLMHGALYVFMLTMPILGWLLVSAAGHSVWFYGLELAPLIDADPALAKQIKGWHVLGGTLGYWLVGLHAVAGLYHHYVMRDNTLRRMLPKR